MSTPANLEDVVLFIVDESAHEIGITKLMKLVFLADVEHAQLFGERLCDVDINWTWYDHGPFSRRVYEAIESLDEQGYVHDTMAIRHRLIRPAESTDSTKTSTLTPAQRYALGRVLHRYGSLSLKAVKQVAYATQTMHDAEPGMSLDVLREPRRSLVVSSPALGTLFERAPKPDTREWGDPERSAAEDLTILQEFSALRREANEEIR